jgi:hypothetical protein
MDTSAANVNVTVDDFDSVLSYPDQSIWQTPDPSSTSFTANGSPWLMGTYHKTDVVGASVSFNFTGMYRVQVFFFPTCQFELTGTRMQGLPYTSTDTLDRLMAHMKYR